MKNDHPTEKFTPRKIGLARVSTGDQLCDLQINALRAFGCEKIFEEKVSGGIHPHERKAFCAAKEYLREGDVFAVWKLDRLGRSLRGIIEAVDGLRDAGVQFVSLTENIDTTTATGRAFWQFIGLMAELERELIRERTIEGLQAARLRGVKLGPKFKLSDEQVIQAYVTVKEHGADIADLAYDLGVSRQTLQRGFARLKLCA